LDEQVTIHAPATASKPANLYTCRKGLTFDFLKVLDFGLVKEGQRKEPADAQITQQGITSGTPGYMAPEMATNPHGIDARADLYALGCVGFWLLSGENVFSADTPIALILKQSSWIVWRSHRRIARNRHKCLAIASVPRRRVSGTGRWSNLGRGGSCM